MRRDNKINPKETSMRMNTTNLNWKEGQNKNPKQQPSRTLGHQTRHIHATTYGNAVAVIYLGVWCRMLFGWAAVHDTGRAGARCEGDTARWFLSTVFFSFYSNHQLQPLGLVAFEQTHQKTTKHPGAVPVKNKKQASCRATWYCNITVILPLCYTLHQWELAITCRERHNTQL